MANAFTWPAFLPTPTLSGNSANIDLGIEESEMEGGGIRTRQRYDNYASTYSLTMVCNKLEAARLLSFIAEVGSASFDIDLILPEDPFALKSTFSAKFVGRLSSPSLLAPNIRSYTISLFVEAIEPEGPDTFAALDAYGTEAATANILDLLDTYINTDIPAAHNA